MNQIKAFKIISTLEALSFLILLLIAMPLKYFFEQPLFVKYIGWVHGLLFVLYIIGAFIMYKKLNWSMKIFAIAVVCSLIPLGPFYVEKHYLPQK